MASSTQQVKAGAQAGAGVPKSQVSGGSLTGLTAANDAQTQQIMPSFGGSVLTALAASIPTNRALAVMGKSSAPAHRKGEGKRGEEKRGEDSSGEERGGEDSSGEERGGAEGSGEDSSTDVYCMVCKSEEEGEIVIVCDRCNRSFHPSCLKLQSVPDTEQWFCERCSLVLERQKKKADEKAAAKQARLAEAQRAKAAKLAEWQRLKDEKAAEKAAKAASKPQPKPKTEKPASTEAKPKTEKPASTETKPKAEKPASTEAKSKKVEPAIVDLTTPVASPRIAGEPTDATKVDNAEKQQDAAKKPRKQHNIGALERKLERAKVEKLVILELYEAIEGSSDARQKENDLKDFRLGITSKAGLLFGPQAQPLVDSVKDSAAKPVSALAVGQGALFGAVSPKLLPAHVYVSIFPMAGLDVSALLPITAKLSAAAVQAILDFAAMDDAATNYAKYRALADFLGGLRLTHWSVLAIDGIPISTLFELLEPRPAEIRSAMDALHHHDHSVVPFSHFAVPYKSASTIDAAETPQLKVRAALVAGSSTFPIEDQLLELPQYRPLRTQLPPLPEPVKEAAQLGVPEQTYADILQIFDFIRMFARISDVTAGMEGEPELLLQTGVADTDEIRLLPELESRISSTQSVLGSLQPAQNVIDARKQHTTISVADPSMATISDYVAAFSENTVRAYRFLARMHISLLRVLIDDRDDLLQRGNADDDEDGVGEDDGDDEREGEMLAKHYASSRARRKDQRSRTAFMYENAMTHQEWELEVTLAQLNIDTWPEVLRRAVLFGPLGAELRSLAAKSAIDAVLALCKADYMALSLSAKVALCKALIDGVAMTETFARIIDKTAVLRTQLIDEKSKTEAEEEYQYKERAKRTREDLLAKEKPIVNQIAAAEIEGMLAELDSKPKDEESGKPSTSPTDDGVFDETVAVEAGMKPAEIARLKLEYERRQKDSGKATSNEESVDPAVRSAIIEQLKVAYDTRSISDLKDAIRNAKDANMESGRGASRHVDPHLQLAYVHLEMMEAEDALERKASDLRKKLEKREKDCERKVEKLRTRAICLGQDRFFRTYFLLAGDRSRVYVQSSLAPSSSDEISGLAAGAYASLHSSRGDKPITPVADQLAPVKSKKRTAAAGLEIIRPRLVDEYPTAASVALEVLEHYEAVGEKSTWGVLVTYDDVMDLLDALDVRGIRERLLDSNIRRLIDTLKEAMPRKVKQPIEQVSDGADKDSAGAVAETEHHAALNSKSADSTKSDLRSRKGRMSTESDDGAERDGLTRLTAEAKQDTLFTEVDAQSPDRRLADSVRRYCSVLSTDVLGALSARGVEAANETIPSSAEKWGSWRARLQSAVSVKDFVELLKEFEAALYLLQKQMPAKQTNSTGKRTRSSARGAHARGDEAAEDDDIIMIADGEPADASRLVGWSDGEDMGDAVHASSIHRVIYPSRPFLQHHINDEKHQRLLDDDNFYEQEIKNELEGDFALWACRSQRRNWRNKLLSSLSFARVSLAILELHDACAALEWCTPPKSIFAKTSAKAEVVEPQRKDVKGKARDSDTDDDIAPEVSAVTKGSRSAKSTSGSKRLREEPAPKASKSAKSRGSAEEAVVILDDTSSEDEIPAGRRTAQSRDAKRPRYSESNSTSSEDEHNDECHECGRGGDLICCDTCPLVFHPKCVGLKAVPKGEWICPKCSEEKCGKCGKGPIPPGQDVLCGDGKAGCDRPFHLRCVGLSRVPAGDWFCDSCKKKLRK